MLKSGLFVDTCLRMNHVACGDAEECWGESVVLVYKAIRRRFGGGCWRRWIRVKLEAVWVVGMGVVRCWSELIEGRKQLSGPTGIIWCRTREMNHEF